MGMDAGSTPLECRFLLVGIEAEDPLDLRRGNEVSRGLVSHRAAHMSEPLRLMQVPLAALQPLFRLLCRGDVHRRTNELEVARFIAHAVSHDVQMLDGAIGHQQSMLEIEIPSIPRCALHDPFDAGRVLRMNAPEDAFHGRFGRSVVFEDSKGFLRPEDLAARHAPGEAPRATEALGFRQAGFAAPQRLLLPARLSGHTDTAEYIFPAFGRTP